MMEAAVHKIPGEGSDDIGEALGGLVAGPFWGNGGDGAGLEKDELIIDEPPLDVLGKTVMLLYFLKEVVDCFEIGGGEARRPAVAGVEDLVFDAARS